MLHEISKSHTHTIKYIINRYVNCNPGYTLSQAPSCNLGTWDLTNVRCEANTCTSTQVANSDKAVADSIQGVTGAVVTVSCDEGYSGGGDISCQTDGTFQSTTCEANSCDPYQVSHSLSYKETGSIVGETGDTYNVYCDEGYAGGGIIECRTNGFFTSASCEPESCGDTSVENSLSYSQPNSIQGVTGESVTVTCAQGYEGGGTISCRPTNLFDTVTCGPSACNAYQVANSNYEASGSITGVTGDQVAVSCKQGYSGGGLIECQIDGSFQSATCEPNICTSSQVANSDMSGADSISGVVGDSVEVNCDVGFSGSGTVTCTIDEVFTSITCSPNACSDGVFENSNRDSSNPLVGVTFDTIEVVCNHGYKGGGVATCQSSGVWSNPGECEPWDCSRPDVTNGNWPTQDVALTRHEGDAVSVADVTCSETYFKTDEVTFPCVCEEDGTPCDTLTRVCQSNGCSIPAVTNGFYSSESWSQASDGTSLGFDKVICDDGYSKVALDPGMTCDCPVHRQPCDTLDGLCEENQCGDIRDSLANGVTTGKCSIHCILNSLHHHHHHHLSLKIRYGMCGWRSYGRSYL